MQKLNEEALNQVTGGAYSPDQAMRRAVGNAGLRMDQVRNLKFEGDEVSFSFNHENYRYKMDMATGSILNFQKSMF